MSPYLCGGQRRQLQRRPPPSVPSHPWRPAGLPAPRTVPAVRSRRRAPGRGEAIPTGEDQLVNPGRAGRGAGPEVAAAGGSGGGELEMQEGENTG